MSAKAWKVGIVGCGRIAGLKDRPTRSSPVRTHAQAYNRHGGFQLAACVNPTEELLRKFQKKWKIPNGYRDLAAMLEKERLDVISLCSPSEFHASQVEEILASASKPQVLFVEKPVCLQEQKQYSLLRKAEESGVKILVNHSRRFDPVHQELRKLIGTGTLGNLTQARCLYYGGWLNNGVHLIDTLRMLLSQGLSLVSSRPAGHGRGKDTNLDLDLRVGEATIEIRAFDERRYQLFEMDLCFEQGRIRLLDAGFRIMTEKVKVNAWGERVLSPVAGFPKKGLVSPLAEAVRGIARVLGGKAKVLEWGVDLPTALKTMQFLWKAQAMAELQQEAVHAL